jgi:integrase
MSDNKRYSEKYDKETGLYNKEIKEDFIANWCNEGYTADSYRNTLRIASVIENDLDKDIFEFNNFEFADLLRSFRATTLRSLNTSLTILRRYVEWAVTEGHCDEILLVTKMFNKEKLAQYLNKSATSKFITWDELNKMVDTFIQEYNENYNYQDIVLLYLTYEGLRGNNNCELTNLKVENVDFENKIIYIKDENGNVQREIKAHPRTIEMIERAIDEDHYNKLPRKKEEKKLKESTLATGYELVRNQYVLRQPVKEDKEKMVGHAENEPVTWFTINSRIKRLAVRMNKLYMTTVSVHQSGMLNRVAEIEESKGDLTTEDYKSVARQFGINESGYFSIKELYLTLFNPESVDSIK